MPRVARANGRFPQSISVEIQPGNDQVVLLGLTFGLGVSTDGGNHFAWVCEDSLGYTGTFDPAYAIGTDGTFYASSFDGLRTSKDGGCTFPVHPDLTGPVVADVDVGPDGHVYAAGSWDQADGVWRSVDNGVSFTKTSLTSGKYSWWTTIAVAPSDATRVYAAGYVIGLGSPDAGTITRALLYRSDDGGDSWSPVDLSTVTFASDPSVEVRAVWPDDPNTFFITVIRDGGVGEALYRTDNGGTSFSKVLDADNRIGSVLVTSDGSKVIVGGAFGVYISTDDGLTFPTHETTPQLACSVERSDGTLLGGGTNWDPDFMALGTSPDGTNWTPIFRFDNITGALSCPSGTIQHDTCEDKFFTTVCPIAPTIAVCPQPDAGVGADAGPTPDGGGGGGGGGKGCCSNDVGGGESAAALALLVLLALVRRRRSAPGSR